MSYKIPQKDIIVEVEIDDYPERILTSGKRRTYYKKWSRDMPKKYKGYAKDKEGYLLDKDGKRLIKNTRTAGQPRYYNLRGEDLWSFNINVHTKSNVFVKLKKIYYEAFRGMDPELFVGKLLGIEFQFHGPTQVNGRNEEDLDNMERWHKKAVLDSLAGHVEFIKQEGGGWLADQVTYPPILTDDNLNVIREIPVRFIEAERRKLVIRIYEI